MLRYHPEDYWSAVGKIIEDREEGGSLIAGDDEPYYRYKRQEFLKLLNECNFKGKSVLEIGHGPGGNLLEVYKHNPSRLAGVDISEQMVKLATNRVPANINVQKINGTQLPFKDKEFDIVFTATVLQHNTDSKMLEQLVREIARVSSEKVLFFERIENKIKGDELCLGRPIEYYSAMMKSSKFVLRSTKFINIRISYFVSGVIRKVLNPKTRKEGEPLSKFSIFLQRLILPLSSKLDKVFISNSDICRLEYIRQFESDL